MALVRKLLKKLEVENEPGLSNGQLMLTNHDLRLGEIIEQTS
jgi:NCS1 family nucleobase:cation symporter-1